MRTNLLDQSQWRAQCEALAQQTAMSCGAIDAVYVQRFSFAVGVHMRDVPHVEQDTALAIAREYGYATAGELAQMADELARMGLCSHGLNRDCCPLGCGDVDSEPDEDTTAALRVDSSDPFQRLLAQVQEDSRELVERFDWAVECALSPLRA